MRQDANIATRIGTKTLGTQRLGQRANGRKGETTAHVIYYYILGE